MRRDDFVLAGVWTTAVGGLAAAALLLPGAVFLNFGDLFAYHYPLRHLVESSLEAGRLPFWNPYIFGGVPLLGDTQAALFYPVSLLGYFFPLLKALAWDGAFHLWWAGAGGFLLARRSGLAGAWALLLGASYALSPFLVYRSTEGIPTLLASLSWIPWVWLFWLYGRPLYLAGAWALQFFSGHPQFMALNGVAMILWALITDRRLLMPAAAAGAAFLALGAVLWMPAAEFVGRSIRTYWPAVYSNAYSLTPREAFSWFYVPSGGTPLSPGYDGVPSVFFESSGLWLGGGCLLAGLWGLAAPGRRRARIAAALLVAAGIFLAGLGSSERLSFLLRMGPLRLIRTPARCLVLSLWGWWWLSLAGLSEAGPRLAKSWPRAALAAAVLSLGFLWTWDRGYLRAQDGERFLRINPDLAALVGGRPFRVLTDPGLANQDKTMLYRAMNVNGYAPTYLRGYPEYVAASEGRAAADQSRTYLRNASTSRMRDLGLRFVIPSGGRPVRAGVRGTLARFGEGAAPPVVAVETPEIWRITGRWPASAEALDLSQPFYPGWRAYAAGGELALRPWLGYLSRIERPAGLPPGGSFEILLEFAPTGWAAAVLAGLAAWLLWFKKAALSGAAA